MLELVWLARMRSLISSWRGYRLSKGILAIEVMFNGFAVVLYNIYRICNPEDDKVAFLRPSGGLD